MRKVYEESVESIGELRAIRDDELDLILSWRNNPKIRANMYTRHEITPEEHLRWWQDMCSKDDRSYFMYERERTPLGVIGFSQIDRQNSNASWAFYSAPNAARGTGSRMEFLALDHAFGQMQLHKLHCEVLAFNSAVVALHQKFGFQIEGCRREQHELNGEYVDIILIGILATEWGQKRDEILNKLVGRANGT